MKYQQEKKATWELPAKKKKKKKKKKSFHIQQKLNLYHKTTNEIIIFRTFKLIFLLFMVYSVELSELVYFGVEQQQLDFI